MNRQLLGLFTAFCGLSLATEAQVVLNEINLVTGPNAGQFFELHGPANQSVDGHALVVVKSSFSEGSWTATVQDVVDSKAKPWTKMDSSWWRAKGGRTQLRAWCSRPSSLRILS